MTLIKQPRHSKLCGHATVAMILGVTLHEATRLIGHQRGTQASELRSALSRSGVILGPPVLTRHHQLPGDVLAIVRASKKGRRNWHWMLSDNGRILDPGSGSLEGFEITSYMRIVQCKIA